MHYLPQNERKGTEEIVEKRRSRRREKGLKREETDGIKTHSGPYLLQAQQALPSCKPKSTGHHDAGKYNL